MIKSTRCFELSASVIFLLVVITSLSAQSTSTSLETTAYETITFASTDGLKITADLYQPHSADQTPWIVLCHQAGWSRGEYREIAPKLGELGFNCLAMDQRSGGAVNQVENETAKIAKRLGKGTGFVDAEQDIVIAIEFIRKKHATGKLLLWGSSYSSALALRIAGEQPKLIDGVLAFAPGEYFGRFGKPDNWIAQSAAKITVPTLITSAKNERPRWQAIYAAIPGDNKVQFLPSTPGKHGSRALWSRFSDSQDYWKVVTAFLQPFAAEGNSRQTQAPQTENNG